MGGTKAVVDVDIGIDVMYNHQFIQNEQVCNLERGREAVYALSETNLVVGGLVASVYLGDTHVGVFADTADNGYKIIDPSEQIASVRINRYTGKLFIVWLTPIKKGESRVIVSYEYRTKS